MPEDPSLSLRSLGPADASAALAADVYDGPALADAVRRFLGPPGQPDPRNILILAETGGRIVGFASATLIDHPDKPTTLFINELGVNEDHQRRGIGRALLAAIRAEGRARGCRQSFVLTEDDNTAARALYLGAKGAETTGIVLHDRDEPGCPPRARHLPLRPPARPG